MKRESTREAAASNKDRAMRIPAISGSLRAQSTNTTLLSAVELAAPRQEFDIDLYDELEQLPPFNPDRETELQDKGAIARFRKRISNADAVVISTPEYARGMPGVLKNASIGLLEAASCSEKPVAMAQGPRRST